MATYTEFYERLERIAMALQFAADEADQCRLYEQGLWTSGWHPMRSMVQRTNAVRYQIERAQAMLSGLGAYAEAKMRKEAEDGIRIA